MADNIRISPQGYVYGEEPLSDHPFWDEGPAGADQYVKEVTGTSTTEGTVTTYDIKYTDQDDVSHDVISIPVDSAGGGGGTDPLPEPSSTTYTAVWRGTSAYRLSTGGSTLPSYFTTPVNVNVGGDVSIDVMFYPNNTAWVNVVFTPTAEHRNEMSRGFTTYGSPTIQFYNASVEFGGYAPVTVDGTSGRLAIEFNFLIPSIIRGGSTATANYTHLISSVLRIEATFTWEE